MPLSLSLVVASLLIPTTGPARISGKHQTPIYLDPTKSIEARVQDIASQLTLDDKMDLLTGTAFTTRPLRRFGIPAIAMADAGQGVRGGMDSTLGPATAFPSGVAMASTWNPSLVGQIAKAIGEEAANKGTGVQVLLGPAINIQRSPLGGRNGEYFSEDPYLAARLTVGYVKGMQSTGVAASLKHFAANNEEVDRDYVNVIVGERALREIYLPAFEAGVTEGQAWTVMSSYNKVNGYHSSANRYLLTDILKRCWGFTGMVMSDWGGVHEVVGPVLAGNDLEMPGPGFLTKANLRTAYENGQISAEAVNQNAERVLRLVARVGGFNPPHTPHHEIVNSPAHQTMAYKAATEGIVLLKNQGAVLPLNRNAIHSIAVIGPSAKQIQVGANGSPTVQPFYTVQPLDGIKKQLPSSVQIHYAKGLETGQPIPSSQFVPAIGTGSGLMAEYFKNRQLSGTPLLTRIDKQIQFNFGANEIPNLGRNDFSVRWTGKLTAPKSGTYKLILSADDGCRLFLDGKKVIDHWIDSGEEPISAQINLTQGQSYDIRVEYYQASGAAVCRLDWITPDTQRYADAIKAAKSSDVAVVCVSTLGQEAEGVDRPSMDLPGDQDGLIQAVAAVNKKTIVVLNNGTPVSMTKWVKDVPAILETWFPGQEGGNALAAILFGDVNPSGKLPNTMGASRTDYPDTGNFPGKDGKVTYAEGIYVGYRHFDKRHIAPIFPFGHGLSYTTFKYSHPLVSKPSANGTVYAKVNVTNTGPRAGAEVVQLYVQDNTPKVDKPVRELRGFQKVYLLPGQTQTLSFTLSFRAFAYCDVAGRQWRSDSGLYRVLFGSSSRDLRIGANVALAKTYVQPIPYLEEQKPRRQPGDLAFGKPVQASSTEKLAGLSPSNIVDGDDSTRWGSEFSDPQWIAVDLEAETSIGKIVIKWERAYSTDYLIQTSSDNVRWKTIFETQSGIGGAQQIQFVPTNARWVRVLSNKRATEFGVSIYSLEVYAPKK